MTPKEKAEELYDKYSYSLLFIGSELHRIKSKECALITVDEMLNILFQHHEIDYWKEVKTEIKKL
jgi:hypothetical protein